MTPADRAALIAEARAALNDLHCSGMGALFGTYRMERAIDRLASALEQAQQDAERLREALGHYGYHKPGCALVIGGELCTCGLTAIRDGDGKWLSARVATPAPDDARNTEVGG